MGDLALVNEILEKRGEQHINWNCVDYMGRNSLHLAVDAEKLDLIEALMEQLSFEGMEEGLLHAISKGMAAFFGSTACEKDCCMLSAKVWQLSLVAPPVRRTAACYQQRYGSFLW